MSAKEKIEGLTNSWYGFAVAAALLSLFQNGIGVFSLLATAASFVFSVVVTFALGRLLLGRSSFTRVVLLVLSAIGTVTGSLATVKLAGAFFDAWSLKLLLNIALVAAGVSMNFKSLRTLTDPSVKLYFR